jgi:ubiquinone/menaquinone biosynthesis C-methylase UbiE
MESKSQINREEKTHFDNFEARGSIYNKRTYSNKARQLYANLRTDEIFESLERYLNLDSDTKILDVGCGTGVFINQLSKRKSDLKLYGIDFSNTMIVEAKHSLLKDNIESSLLRASAFELPFTDNFFDAVIATRFIHQYSDNLKKQLISEMKRCLKDNGVIIIEFYSSVPRLSRYLFKPQVSSKTLKENLKHCPTRRTVKKLVGNKYNIIPLMLPGSTKAEKIIGIAGINILRKFFEFFRMNFIFDQYLIIFRKK